MQDHLERFDFQILETKTDEFGYFKELSAKRIDQPVFVVIERLDESFQGDYMCYIKLVGQSNFDLFFTISAKSRSYNVLLRKDGITDDYLIEATDVDQIVEFIEYERIFPIFQNLLELSIDHKVEVNSKDGKFLVRLKTNCDMRKSLAVIPLMEGLNWIFRQNLSFENLVEKFSLFLCTKCDEKVEIDDYECPNCGSDVQNCVICRREVGKDDQIVQVMCCKSYIHQKELKSWFSIRNNCPYCLSENQEIVSIQFEED